MTPSTLLALWVANWLVMSAVVIFIVKNRQPDEASSRLDLWDLEDNVPGLVALLLLAWPVALFRLVPVVLPPSARRGAGPRQ